MEKIKILKFNNIERNSYESIIPYSPYYEIIKEGGDDNHDKEKEQWSYLLIHYLSTNLMLKINDIKLILFEKEIVVIVDDKNCIIVFNIEKFKVFLRRKKIYMQGVNCNYCEPLSRKNYLKDKMSNKCKGCRDVKTHIMDSYKNSYTTIESKKFNINIVKINFIESKKINLWDKLILLTESNEIYTVKIGIPNFYESKFSVPELLYKNIDYYHIFTEKILFRQIKNNTESYSLSSFNKLGTKKVVDELLSQKFKIDITDRNVITHIFTENGDKYAIYSIDDTFIFYCLMLETPYFLDDTSYNYTSYQSKCYNGNHLNSTSISDDPKILKNGIMKSYIPNSKKTGVKNCSINNEYVICVMICFNYSSWEKDVEIYISSINTYNLIMTCCYYIIRLQDYVIFFLSQGGTLIYDQKLEQFIDDYKDINIIHCGQLKTNELINWRQPYLQLNDIIKNEKLKNVLIRLIVCIKSMMGYYIPVLCLESIFSYIKEYDLLNVLTLETKEKRKVENVLTLETKEKRKAENVLNLTNKKQKIK